MTIEERLDKLEANWGKTDPLVRELRDAVTVTAELENRQGKLLKENTFLIAEHHEAIRNHEAWLKRHDTAMADHNSAMKDLDIRIAELVSGIGAFIAAQKQP
jgi:hypothetical protein